MSVPLAEKRFVLSLPFISSSSASDFNLYREKYHPRVPKVLESPNIIPSSNKIEVHGMNLPYIFE